MAFSHCFLGPTLAELLLTEKGYPPEHVFCRKLSGKKINGMGEGGGVSTPHVPPIPPPPPIKWFPCVLCKCTTPLICGKDPPSFEFVWLLGKDAGILCWVSSSAVTFAITLSLAVTLAYGWYYSHCSQNMARPQTRHQIYSWRSSHPFMNPKSGVSE